MLVSAKVENSDGKVLTFPKASKPWKEPNMPFRPMLIDVGESFRHIKRKV